MLGVRSFSVGRCVLFVWSEVLGLASDSPVSILYLLLNQKPLSQCRLWVLLLYLLRNRRALGWWFRQQAEVKIRTHT